MAAEFTGKPVVFPRARLDSPFDFSFSGLKTAVVNHWNKNKKNREAVIAGFQEAAVDVLVRNTRAAVNTTGIHQVVLGGGVAANNLLRSKMLAMGADMSCRVFIPPKTLCTDNGAMIAAAAYLRLRHKKKIRAFSVQPNAPLVNWRGKKLYAA
ncbi:MAG: hypothetical protein GF384_02875 [Elusimicrobia bacterium]|nr:hypothetical protein [Elusimicrobiota bacterium]MBD3411896.1 hypothetical protein [Elusimicrobiota bacterium]